MTELARVSTLTQKQLDALRLAREVGMYEIPRRGTLDHVATRLHISKAAAHNRLQAAEHKILLDFLDRDNDTHIARLEAELAAARATVTQ